MLLNEKFAARVFNRLAQLLNHKNVLIQIKAWCRKNIEAVMLKNLNYFVVSYNDPQNFRRETPTTSHVQVQELNFFVYDFNS